MYLGLDLSLTSTGASIFFNSDMFDTTTFPVKKCRGIQRLQQVIDQLKVYVDGDNHAIDLAAIENYAFAGKGHTYHLGELGGLVRYHLKLWGIPFIVPSIQQVKLFATGRGNATKADVGRALRDKWGQDFLSTEWPGYKRGAKMPENWGEHDNHWRNDEADAFVLANIAALYAGDWDREPTPYQERVIEEIRLDPEGILSTVARDRLRGN